MLIVKPIEDKTEQKRICEACGAVYDADLLACAAHVAGDLIGVCQFEFSGDKAIIHDIRQKPGVDDFEAMFIMTRGALNFIDLCGFHRAVCSGDAGDQTLLRATGFKEVGENQFEIDLTHAFDGKCDHCK